MSITILDEHDKRELNQQIETKLDKSGWTAHKYLGTDAEGNVVEKEAPEGTGSGLSPNGNGLTSTEKSLILFLFKNVEYTADMSATIAQLETLWSGGTVEPEPDEPVIPDADVSQTGSILTIVGVADITKVAQSGTVLTMT